MFAHRRDGMAHRTDALEICSEPIGVVGKALDARS
jgi:hypothetical protein